MSNIQYSLIPSEEHGGETEIEKFGYKQQLERTLGLFSTFGLAFSYISPVVGVYTMFGFGLVTGGPLFIWGLPLVVFGQLMVAFVFSELTVRYPITGGLYQWGLRLVGPRYGWFVGWIYGWALLISVAAVDLGAAPYFLDVIGSSSEETWKVVCVGVGICLFHTFLNYLGVRVTAIVTNIGLCVEIGMTIVLGFFILFGPGPHQHPSILLTTETASGNLPLTSFLPALLAQAFVFFGFESAADVSEEVVDAKKSVPKAMILSLIGAGIVTWFLQICLVIAIPDIKSVTQDQNTTVTLILEAHIGPIFSRILSFLLLIAYTSCGGAIQATISRILFAYARDNMIPFSKVFEKVSERTKVPTVATAFATIFPIVVMMTLFGDIGGGVNINAVIVNYAVIGINLGFQLCVFARLWGNRMFSSVDVGPYFNLKWFSIPVAVIAQIFGVLMIINLVWPRPYTTVQGWLTFGVTAFMAIVGFILCFPMGKRAMMASNLKLLAAS